MSDKPKINKIKQLWDGPYETWSEAKSHVISETDVFATENWKKRLTFQIMHYRKTISKVGKLAMPPRPSNLAHLCAVLRPKSVLDFGGSTGWCWDLLKNSIETEFITRYQVIEHPAVIDFVKTRKFHTDKKILHTGAGEAQKSDLLYANSVLQYFEDNIAFIELVQRSRPRYILLDDLVVNRGAEDYFGLQEYYGDKIPYRFIGLVPFIESMKAIGFEVLCETTYLSPIAGVIDEFPMENFPPKLRIPHSSSILLVCN